MKSRALYKIAREVLYPELKPRGYKEKNGEYTRVLDSGAVHLIGLAKDPHGAETFHIMCGVTALQISEETGLGFGYSKSDDKHHLTPKGWNINSGRWPCETEAEARESLTQVRELVLELALPWLEPHTTLTSVAEEISEKRMPHLGWIKARLLALDGNFDRARDVIDRYAEYAAQPRPWISREHRQGEIDRAEKVRLEIEEAARQAKLA